MFQAKKGFTLIELMVVIVIIGVLAALAIPKFTDASTKAKLSEIPTVIGGWDHAVLARLAETGTSPTDVTDIVFTQPTSKWFSYAADYPAGGPSANVAAVATGINVGNFEAETQMATSSITQSSVVTHTVDAAGAEKYLPNFPKVD